MLPTLCYLQKVMCVGPMKSKTKVMLVLKQFAKYIGAPETTIMGTYREEKYQEVKWKRDRERGGQIIRSNNRNYEMWIAAWNLQ